MFQQQSLNCNWQCTVTGREWSRLLLLGKCKKTTKLKKLLLQCCYIKKYKCISSCVYKCHSIDEGPGKNGK